MLNKRTIFTAISVSVALLLYVAWTAVGFTQTVTADVSFKGRINKQTYVLGEPLNVEFEFTNKGEIPALVSVGGVDSGGLRIFIAGQDGEYERYRSEEWGRKRGQSITLGSGKSQKLKSATILWSRMENVSGLNADAAKRVLADKVTTEYAFPEPGVYFIKGVSFIGENAVPIESEPIKVDIEAPTGDDLEVWNKIKGNKQIAVLMQRGEITVEKETERQKHFTLAEQIFEQFPNSVYSGYLKTNLAKYKADEAKRNEIYKIINRKPE